MSSPVLGLVRLGFPWQTFDPFLFCVHHDDAYPEGNEHMGPDPRLLRGRQIGMDFAGIGGWRMYHGDVVPGFPRHPHRGFETITIARQGYIDHSDSLGATARFGHGDVQWMTAGGGIVHSEMFPLVRRDAPNPAELFQIWINLPRADKMVDPYFTMLWSENIPRHSFTDDAGHTTEVVTVVGSLDARQPPPPPPNSWAARDEANVAIWTIKLGPGARWTAPPTAAGTNRTLYYFSGGTLRVAGEALSPGVGARLQPDAPIELQNGAVESELLMLQGKPLDEPIAHHGPFVMNTRQELEQAFVDYRRTGFGGWPWKTDAPVHPRERGRFAIHADGREEVPG